MNFATLLGDAFAILRFALTLGDYIDIVLNSLHERYGFLFPWIKEEDEDDVTEPTTV